LIKNTQRSNRKQGIDESGNMGKMGLSVNVFICRLFYCLKKPFVILAVLF